MSKEYDETKVKPTFQESEKANGSKVLLGKRKLTINFDDKKYGVKTSRANQQPLEQEPLKLRDFLKSIPIVGKLLVKIFIPERDAYEKSQSQASHSGKAEDEVYKDDKLTEEVGSRLKEGNVEQVDNKKNRSP